MKTLFETEITPNIKAVIYLCTFNPYTRDLRVNKEILCNDFFDALQIFANTPNPASQLAYETPCNTLEENLEILHKKMQSEDYLQYLSESL